jgi:Txe/YoeB family toxin of Txe-Axe toxin-antitoxin module
MYKNKEVRIVFSENADEMYEELNKIVGEEKNKGNMTSFHQTLLRSIERVKELLRNNPFAGDQVQKSLIPKVYIIKYGITNLWRIELANYWRMMYTISGNEVEILNFVLDIVDHKKYNKIFGYK